MNLLSWNISERKFNAVLFVGALLLLITLGHFLDDFKNAAIVLTLGIFIIITYEMRHDARRTWFIMSIITLLCVHLVVIYFVDPMLPSSPALTYTLPVVFIDGFAMYGILRWLRSRLSVKH